MGLALHIEAYFDESGTDGAQLTVAGYLFDATRIGEFSDKWNELLMQHDLPFLHMKDFAPGKKYPFNKLSRDERVRLQMRFMKLIKTYTVNGIVYSLKNEKDNSGKYYNEAAKKAAYSAVEWANQTSFIGKVSYFFEAGAFGQKLLEAEFQAIASDPALSDAHHYATHGFIPKVGNPGVQAADFLAWQYNHYTGRREKKDVARLDFRALLRHPHKLSDECGQLPRDSAIQTIYESKFRLETVHYLPSIDPSKGRHPIIEPNTDFTPFIGKTPGIVLACSNCFRAIAEGIHPRQFSNIGIKCWCGNTCFIPPVLPPFAHY